MASSVDKILDQEILTPAQAGKKGKKARDSAIDIRNLHWPDVTEKQLWLLNDRKRGGFAQVPRTLALMVSAISDIAKRKSGKAIPAGKTYLALWLRAFGEGLVKVENEKDVAYEAGYGGERSVSTFRIHMNILRDLGLIDYKAGNRGPMQYVLMLNPYQVFKRLHAEKLVTDMQYAALLERASAIGSASELKE